jgi:hypothetical protein
VHQSPNPYDPTALKKKALLHSVLKLPEKKEPPSQITLQENTLKIGDRSLGNILQQVEKTVPKPLADVAEESLPEEYDGKIRSGTIFSIGEKVIRQMHDIDYTEYKTKEFKPDDLPKLLAVMLKHETVGITWNKPENRFTFFIVEKAPYVE